MLYNKNNVRKTNDKKILHKVGKQWKVISVALLMAVAGGAVATHAANADDVNANADGNQPYLANDPLQKPVTPKANNQNVAPTSAAIHYYPGHSGAAASYFDKAASDEALVNKNKNTVNSYVQSLNDEYNPQVHSYATQYNSANSAAHNDSKLAQSYNAKINTSETVNTINSLAAKNSMDPTLYEGMVQDNEQAYSGAVNSASNDVKANSDVASLVNSLENMNLSSANMSASASDVVANSNYVGALANFDSVNAKWGNITGGQDLRNAASELSYGAVELYAEGNNVNYDANVASLGQLQGVNGASLTSQFNSAVSSAYTSASNVFSGSIKENNIPAYAGSKGVGAYNNSLVTGANAEALNDDAAHIDVNSANNNFNAAVSAATDIRFAPVLASAANSIATSYGIQYGNYAARSKEGASLVASASAELFNATNYRAYASANSSIVSKLSGMATNPLHKGNSALASYFVNEGVDAVEADLGLVDQNPNYGKYNTYYTINNDKDHNNSKYDTYLLAVNKLANNNDSDVSVLQNFYDNYENHHNSNRGDFVSYLNNYLNSQNNLSNHDKSILANDSSKFNSTSDGLTEHNGTLVDPNAKENVHTADYDNDAAALLSAGVDVKALENESGAIDNVASAVRSASEDTNVYNGNNSNDKFAADLSAAASSADSALGSANNASAEYSAANDEDVTLASYYANSYSNEANDESSAASSAYVAMNNFFKDMTDNNSVFVSADDAYAGAKAAAANDHKMGVENANNVYNNKPHFLDVLKNAKLHSTANFNTKPDEVVATANKGDRLTVLHVAFSRNNSWRGALRYYVLDNTTGKKGFFTGQPQFSKGAYLPSTISTANVSVKALRPVNVYNNYQSKGKPVATLKAGQVVDNVRVVYANPDRDAMGFTKVETSDYNFFTANTDYVTFNTYTVNNNTQNNNNSKFYNLNLGNNGLGNDFNDNSFDY